MLLPPRDLTAYEKLLVLALVLALLVGNAAAGLASRLARGLALAAAAGGHALAEVTGLDGLDSIHGPSLQSFHSDLCAAQFFLYTD